MIYIGDDWAEEHHDIHIMDDQGCRLASQRLPEGVEGIARLHAMVGAHTEDPSQVLVGIETDRGLWVTALVAAGYQVFAVNPMAAARYRERHHVGGAKSDTADAKMLADLVRTDAHNHRPVAGDTAQVEGIKVVARAHQSMVWSRTRETNRLRNSLREYYPTALATFDDLDSGDALAVLSKAPEPVSGARLSLSQIKAALRAGGRRRYLDTTAAQIQAGLRVQQLAAPAAVTAAYAATTAVQVALITALNTQIQALAQELGTHFEQHLRRRDLPFLARSW